MRESFTGSQLALAALSMLVPPTQIAGGQLAWSAFIGGANHFGPSASAPAPAASEAMTVAVAPAVSVPSLSAATPVSAGPVTISARLDRSAVYASGDGLVNVELTITGAAREGAARRVPTDLVVVLDRSGSMSGDPIKNARAATRTLIEGLSPDDRFGLVIYDDNAELAVPLALATPAHKSQWLRTLASVEDRGSTNIGDGIDLSLNVLGERLPGRAQRIVLISDGQPTAGDASPEGLAARARRAALHESPLTAVGVGMSFNETLMRDLADAGTGNYYYVQQTEGLASVFSAEFEAAGATVATGLEVVVHPGAGVQLVSAAGYPLESNGTGASFRIGSLQAGQERRLWLTYRVDPKSAGSNASLGELGARFQADGVALAARLAEPLSVSVVHDQAVALASINKDAWESAVVTERYNRMRDEVADAVRRKDKAAAETALNQYRTQITAENSAVGSAAALKNLESLGYIESSVTDSFTGSSWEQSDKQNAYSKSESSASYFGRRSGQMKGSAGG